MIVCLPDPGPSKAVSDGSDGVPGLGSTSKTTNSASEPNATTSVVSGRKRKDSEFEPVADSASPAKGAEGGKLSTTRSAKSKGKRRAVESDDEVDGLRMNIQPSNASGNQSSSKKEVSAREQSGSQSSTSSGLVRSGSLKVRMY